MSFNIDNIRIDFPILSQKVNGKPLVYFDNGATSQKPQVVIDAISKYYQEIINECGYFRKYVSQKSKN